MSAKAPGEAKTRLIPALGAAGAAALHRQLVMHCLRVATDAQLGPVELWCAPDSGHPFFRECERRFSVSLRSQGQGDLGARMQGAFDAVLARASRAILVGSDIPALSAQYLRDAERALAGGDESDRAGGSGGYVLVGLRGVTPNCRGIPWEDPMSWRRRAAALRPFGA